MLFFKAQKRFDFEQPDWSKCPELYVTHQALEQRLDIIEIAKPCFPNLDRTKMIGRTGMTLEQVVRCAIYMKNKRLSYRELAIQTADSKMCIVFTNMDYGQSFSHQTLQENISKITPEVLNKINIAIGKLAMELGVDNGEKMRTDSTAIESNIHYPTNCSLLWDCIRVAGRVLKNVKKIFKDLKVSTHSQKTAKKLNFKIVNTNGQDKRIPLFKKMLRIHAKFMKHVKEAIEQLKSVSFEDKTLEKERMKYLNELESLLPKMEKVNNVAYRREVVGEIVPVSDKIFSIFEDHTDCIVKGQRDAIFGHKVNLTTGKSGIIFDTIIEKGNPADTNFFPKTIDNLHENYELTPRGLSSDGGYSSIVNLDYAKGKGIENIVFTKNNN